MAKDKKSFLLYCDLIHTIGHLTDEQAGKLFKHILSYVGDLNPITDDVITNLAFEPIKQQLKRDLKAWEQERKGRSDAGKKGMAKRWDKSVKHPITKDNSVIPAITNITDNVTVTVNVTDTVNEILKDIEIGATIQYCVLNLSRDYKTERIVELWQAFLINGQDKNYHTRQKKIQHFRNWIKNQPYDGKTYQRTVPGNNGKLGTSEARIAALKKW